MCVHDNRKIGSIFSPELNIFDNCTLCFANHLKRLEITPSLISEYQAVGFEEHVQVFLTEDEECKHVRDVRVSPPPTPAPANRPPKPSSGPKKGDNEEAEC